MIVALFVCRFEWKLQHHLWETELFFKIKLDYDFNLRLICVFCVRSPTNKPISDCCLVFHLNSVTVTII